MNLSLHTSNSETTKHNSPRPKMLSEKETTRSDNDVPFSNRGVGMYDFFHLSFGHTFLTPKIISENHKTIHRQIRISLRKTNWPDLSIRQPNFKKRHDLPVPKNHSEKNRSADLLAIDIHKPNQKILKPMRERISECGKNICSGNQTKAIVIHVEKCIP